MVNQNSCPLCGATRTLSTPETNPVSHTYKCGLIQDFDDKIVELGSHFCDPEEFVRAAGSVNEYTAVTPGTFLTFKGPHTPGPTEKRFVQWALKHGSRLLEIYLDIHKTMLEIEMHGRPEYERMEAACELLMSMTPEANDQEEEEGLDTPQMHKVGVVQHRCQTCGARMLRFDPHADGDVSAIYSCGLIASKDGCIVFSPHVQKKSMTTLWTILNADRPAMMKLNGYTVHIRKIGWELGDSVYSVALNPPDASIVSMIPEKIGGGIALTAVLGIIIKFIGDWQ